VRKLRLACELLQFHLELIHMPAKKSSNTRGRGKVKRVMHEYKHGELKSGKRGKGGKVKGRKQAIAIALNEARESGAKIPRKKAARKKATAKRSTTMKRKSTARKTTGRKRAA
jgi:hypothetical protein